MADGDRSQRVSLSTLRKWTRSGQRFAMLTCYDALTAHRLWRGGVKTLLVGDTAGHVVLGYDSTLPVDMDFMVAITAAVRRGAPHAFVMADMPFGSYQCGDDEATHNAVRFLKEGLADAVKLEVAPLHVPLLERMSAAGVPVVAHLGSRPQMVRSQGRYRKAYHDENDVRFTVDLAKACIDAGAVMILLEAVPAEVSQQVVDALHESGVPVVGCGGGPACHGHVVVLPDLLGMTDWQPPFVPVVADVGVQVERAAAQWVELVSSGRYLADDHPYRIDP